METQKDLRSRLEGAEKSLLVAEQKLQQMILDRQRLNQSFDWQLFSAFRKTVRRLLPEGSLRFNLVQSCLAVPVAAKRHGIRAGIRETLALVKAVGRLVGRAIMKRGDTFKLLPPNAPDNTLPQHTEKIGIIVCVHNALTDVQLCLSSIFARTTPPYQLIIVDDGSDEETATYLRTIAETQSATLIRNDDARGYTCAANQGMREAKGSALVLLNSDTIVTTGWLARMIRCAASSPKICAVGPLSNTASWQSIPNLFLENGDWNNNPLPKGFSAEDIAHVLALAASPVYPRLPFLNGFCMLIKRRALKSLGLFDEKTFGAGYGEENDFALRAVAAGWELAVTDDAYVFHAQSKSYSHERRLELSKKSDDKLAKKHGTSCTADGILHCQYDRVMSAVRARAGVMLEKSATIHKGLELYEGKRVLFLLPIQGAGGGGHVVIQEAAAMRRMGVDADLANLVPHRPTFEREHPNLDVPVLYVNNPETDIDYGEYDAVIATHYMSVNWVRTILGTHPEIKSGYYIQDYEPFFYEAQSLEHLMARESYQMPEGMRAFVKTTWVRDTLEEHEDLDSAIVGPSVETTLFRPQVPSRPIQPTPMRILAMVRPITPRRAPDLTMRVLSKLAERYERNLSIHIFGCSEADKDFLKLKRDFKHTNWGVLDRERAAALFAQVDIFADFSTFQAMGLTALEAMSCGVATVVPERGGANAFAVHEKNAIVVDTQDEDACFNAISRLIEDRKLTLDIQQAAMRTAATFYPEKAALNILDVLFSQDQPEDIPAC